MQLFVVGPLVSQHIQAWYSKYELAKPVKILTVHDGGKNIPQGFTKICFRPTGTRIDFFLFAPIFWFLWWLYRPSVTNFHYLSSYGLLSLLIPRKNLVLNVWGSDVNLPYVSNSKFKRWLLKRVLARFSWINAPAVHIKEKLISLGADPACIEVFQYGVDLNNLPIKSFSDKKGLTFVSNRNWQSLYRIPLIVEAFCVWLRKAPDLDVELHLYGGGSELESAAIMEVLRRYEDVSHQVKVMGYVEKQKMLEEISMADAFISIPERDGTPLSLLESMHIGLLPIVSDIDANREWLTQSSALWINDYAPESIVTTLQQVHSKLLERHTWLLANREIVQSKACMRTNLSRFYNVLDQFFEAN